MIEFRPGYDIFDTGADCLVCPVNCVGVMGKGLALQFKRRFPEYFDCYEWECKENRSIKLGFPQTWVRQTASEDYPDLVLGGLLGYPKYIVSFPTKGHWSDGSRLEDVDRGLANLRLIVQHERIRSIAIPQLGCGLGGLDWADVRRLIVERMGDLACRVVVLGQ